MKTRLLASPVLAAVYLLLVGCYLFPEKSPVYGKIDEIIINNELDQLTDDLKTHPSDLEYRDDSQVTPLGVAVLHCRTEAAKILLEHHAQIDARASGGSTPLHLAAQRGCDEAVLLLLAARAPINQKDDAGFTPLGVALKWGKSETADLLRAHGGYE